MHNACALFLSRVILDHRVLSHLSSLHETDVDPEAAPGPWLHCGAPHNVESGGGVGTYLTVAQATSSPNY